MLHRRSATHRQTAFAPLSPQIVEDALQESSLTQAHLAEERSTYAPVASLGSTVYFAVRDLRTINHVYQISLPAILALVSRGARLHGVVYWSESPGTQFCVANDPRRDNQHF